MKNINRCPAQSRLVVKLDCVKSDLTGSISGLYSPAFGLNSEIYGVNFRIQSEYGKIQTRKTPNTNTSYVVLLCCIAFDLNQMLVVYINLLQPSYYNL